MNRRGQGTPVSAHGPPIVRLGFPPSDYRSAARPRAEIDEYSTLPGAATAELRPIPSDDLPVADLLARSYAWGNPAIDLSVLNAPQLREFSARGWLEPLELEEGDLSPLSEVVVRKGSKQGEGAVYGIPAGPGVNLIYYDADLLGGNWRVALLQRRRLSCSRRSSASARPAA